MRQYVLRRLLWMVPTLLGITVMTFVVVQLSPGDPVKISMGEGSGNLKTNTMATQIRDAQRRLLELDKPLWQRYPRWLWKTLNLDLGRSYRDWRPVTTLISERLPITLTLNLISLLLAYIIAVPIGVYSAVRSGSISDHIMTVILFILYSLPSFWLAYILIYFFAGGSYYRIFPVGGLNSLNASQYLGGEAVWIGAALGFLKSIDVSQYLGVRAAWVGAAVGWLNSDDALRYLRVEAAWGGASVGSKSPGASQYALLQWLLDRLWHLILPVACLTYASFAGLSRYTRSGMMEILRQDYIRTARAKGLPERIVVFKHAMRNSLIPIVTILAGLLPALIGGSVIIETIFNIPGLGRLAYDAVLFRDYPVIMAEATIGAVLTLLGILLSDILYAIVDPRIKYD